MSDKFQKDPGIILAQIENDWKELQEILRSRPIESGVPQHLGLQTLKRPGNLGERTHNPDEPPAPQSSKSQQEMKTLTSVDGIKPMEAEAIVDRVEKVQRDQEVLLRLAKLEKQTRRTTLLGSMVLTILALAMAVFAFLMAQAHLFDKTGSLPAAKEIISTKSTNSGSTEGKVSAKQSEANAAVKYVGSKTSTKYHYPDCKWAKTIAPERLVTFKSVEEAKKAGYKQCPVCKPPISD